MTRPVALVTGATRGLGWAIAQLLAPDHHVLVGGRDAGTTAARAAELPDAEPFVADLTDADAVGRTVRGVLGPWERLDVLVHNAGVSSRSSVETTSRETWQRMLEINVVAVADLTRLALPHLRAAHGLVVAINSGAGLGPFPDNAPYCATKYALRGFTDVLREEERGRLRVTSIHPGRIDTEMQVALQAQDGRPYDPAEHLTVEDVAHTVRLAVDLPPDACLEELSVRPTGMHT
ncbi:MAG: SDR family oxidoreductase [Pauljensenia sp.]